MDAEYNLGDKVILEGLNGYWEIVGIGSYPDSTKKYVLSIEANHKYKHADGADLVCSENTLKRLTSRN
ncbi:hypothetical protein ACFLZQ_06875 [Thermodesulfobacteriota bacterium]